MLPAQRNKVDLGAMTEEEKKLFRLYGKLPTHKNVLAKVQKDRKYFDSGDYALSKAGVAPQSNVGTAIPSPETIPHASPPSNLSMSTQGTPNATPGTSGLASSPNRDSPLSTAGVSPLMTDNLVDASAEVGPSTSPTSSYPIAVSEHAHSPLNPASGSASTSAQGTDSYNVATDGADVDLTQPVDLNKVVPGVDKSALPTSATPMSGEEADTEMK
ncbi:hypothetical protein FS842_009887 [Serendipita sp. 407]|nr:hypothetical protein FS842_009887 [Serendipita sp. 407]